MINGFAAEQIVFNLIKSSPKIKSFKLPTSEELINIASQSSLGRKRIKSAYPYLLEEFGVNYREENTNQLRQAFDWKLVPNTIILDYIFGIDAVVYILGFVVAIDVTANPNTLEEKQQKLTLLKPLWQRVGIDKACVCYVNKLEIDLFNRLKTVIKQDKVLAILL
jgi:hypothetical protein